MFNPLKLCKATAVPLPANWARKGMRLFPEVTALEAEGKLRGCWSLFYAMPSPKGICTSLWFKNTAFLQQITEETDTKRGARPDSVWVAVRFEISFLYHQNRTEAAPRVGAKTDSQDEDKCRCSWWTVGGFEDGVCLFWIEFQRGAKSFWWSSIRISA